SFYSYEWPYSLARAVKHGALLLYHHAQRPAPRGRASLYQVGDWVRVKEAAAVRSTLDRNGRLRGLPYAVSQWAYCGGTYQVERVVRRMLGDDGWVKAISGTVVLADVVCNVTDHPRGCQRCCSLYFRDEWLEPSTPQVATRYLAGPSSTTARVKSLPEIMATLDAKGRLDGMSFSVEEMAEHVGEEYPVLRKLSPSGDIPGWKKPCGEWYVLEGARCRGRPLGGDGACDRNCSLLWHRSWLEIGGPAAGEGARAPGC
ncbi:MAG: hypothetical protein ACRDZX_03565, partial [Acidimicrobiales bacterium]